jgi:hypothetical protein
LPTGQYRFSDVGLSSPDETKFNIASTNAYRLPSYHKLDLNATYKFVWLELPFEIYLNIYNLYNRKNSFARYITFRKEGNENIPQLNEIALFPFIPTRMKIIFAIALSFLLFSCEDVNIVENDLNYEEFIVIRSELKAAKFYEGVSITRTLPLSEGYDFSKAEINDANAFVKVNKVQVVPLHYTNNGIYKPLYDLPINPGNTYELFAEVNGKPVYSITRVPEIPTVKGASYQSGSYLTAEVNAKPHEVYGAVWAIVNIPEPPSLTGEDFFSIAPTVDIDYPIDVAVRTEDIPEEYRNEFYREKTYIKIYAFDLPYLDYFKTKFNNRVSEDSFTGSSGPVAWNVQGEKVIGLFIGSAEGGFIKP